MSLGLLIAPFQNKPRNGSLNDSPPLDFVHASWCCFVSFQAELNLLICPQFSFLMHSDDLRWALPSSPVFSSLLSPILPFIPVNIQYVHPFKIIKILPLPYSPLAIPSSSPETEPSTEIGVVNLSHTFLCRVVSTPSLQLQ